MTSEIRTNTLKNRVGLGTVSFTNTGPVVSGIITANGLELNSLDTGSSAGPEVKLFRNSASPANADYLGQLKFAGESSTGVERNYAKITGKILSTTNGAERGILEFAHIKSGTQTITGRWRDDSLQLLNDTNLSVAGNTTLTGDIDVDGHTNLDNVSIAGVTSVASLTSGRVVTVGTAGKLQDSANLTFDGAEFDINNASGSARLYLISGNSADSSIYFGRQNDGATGGIRYEHTNDSLKFMGYNNADKMVIDSSGNVLVGTTDSSLYNNGDSDSEGIVLRGGEVIDIARKGDLQLTLNRQTNDGPHIAFYRSGAAKHFISTFDNDLVFEIGGSSSSYRKHRFNSTGDILLGAHGSRIFDDSSGTNIVVDIYGGATAGKRGILALGGRTGSDDGDIGTIQFLNENNNLATSANHVQSKLVASIDVKSQTTTSNSGANSGAHLIFSTKGENAALAERLRITSDGNVYHTGGDGRRYSFAGDGTSHYMKYDNTLGGIILNGYGGIAFETNGTNERLRITSGGQIRLPINGQQLTWGASQQMKFYYENSEERMYLQGDGAYGFAFRVNGGNRIEISKTTGDVVMQGASGRNFQWDNSEASLYLTDPGSSSSARLKIGTNGDLLLYHDTGGANHITCATNQELKLSANQFSFYDYTGVTRRALLDSNGNMGLGITPAYSGLFGGAQRTFHIGGTAAPCLRITSSSSGQADLVLHAGNSARRADIANMATNGSISIWTKPSSGSIAERIKISSAGYVTKPATPAFFATHTNASSTIIGTLTYNTSGNGYYNNGGHLDVSSGRFHAPVDGIYHFHFHGFFQSGQGNSYYEVIMYRRNSNGGGALGLTRQYGYRDQATNQYGPSISMQCTCSLTAGQTVEVSTGGLSFHGANGWYFGGHLLG